MRPAASLLAVGSLVLSCAGAAANDMIAAPVAVLQGLDKITARVSDFDAPVGKPVAFGDLSILVRACDKSPPIDPPETAAFLEIGNKPPGGDKVTEFSGWMFAQSPALSALQDPVYDVILLDCKGGSSGSTAPIGADGNTAR